jgi:Domain of unknown function (DUF4349)
MSEQVTVKKSRKNLKYILLLVSGGVLLAIISSMLIGIFAYNSGQNAPAQANLTQDSVMSEGGEVSRGSGGSVNKPAPTAAANYAAAPGTSTGSTATGQQATGYTAVNAQNDPNRMIIRNATIALDSEDVEKTLADIRALVGAQQGTVFSSNTSLRGDKTYATMVLQVPSQAYDVTMAQLRKVGYRVQNETSSSQDVTEEFADAQAQLRNLQATEAQYIKLLEKAITVNDIITVQNQLTNVRGQIERLQGRMNFLQKKSDVSTITVSITPYFGVTKVDNSAWEFGKVLENAWAGSLRGLQGLVTAMVTVGVYLVWLLPLGLVLGLIGFILWRKTFPRKPKQVPVTDL